MSNYIWQTTFRALFDRCLHQYDSGNGNFESWFNDTDKEYLASIGCREREFFDFVEDHANSGGGEPTVETALLIAAARRDYLNAVQHGKSSDRIVKPSELPAKTAEMDGIPWLPRIIVKARAKLAGEMDPDTMFGCGGDRAFCAKHDIHPADLLRAVWAADGDDQRILKFVKSGGNWA